MSTSIFGSNGITGLDLANLTSSSYTMTSGSSNNYNWNITSSPAAISQSGTMELRGANADIVVNGRSLTKTLDEIQARLAMLEPNPALEQEWNQLKELGDAYRKLEAELKEKARMWETLKK